MSKDFRLNSEDFFKKVQETNTPFLGILSNVFNNLLKDCHFKQPYYLKIPGIVTYYIGQKYHRNNMSIIDRTSVIYYQNKPLFLVSSVGFIHPLNVKNRSLKIIDKDLYQIFCQENMIFNFKKYTCFSTFIPPEFNLYYKLTYSEIIAKVHLKDCYIYKEGKLILYDFMTKTNIKNAIDAGFISTHPRNNILPLDEQVCDLYFKKITPNLGGLD